MSCDGMEELLNMILEKRIDMLLVNLKPERGEDIFREAEKAVEALPTEIRETFHLCRQTLWDLQMQEVRKAYIGGIMDGVRLAGCIDRIEAEGQVDWERWVEQFIHD